MTAIILLAHNLRSAHNVGSLLRTADGLGVSKVYLTGYSPYPQRENSREIGATTGSTADSRLPHVAVKTSNQIAKTALGAEKLDFWEHAESIEAVITQLRAEGYTIAALEQASGSLPLPDFKPPAKLALIVGREVEGIEPEILVLRDLILEIPMLGRKESFNVVQAAAMALYHVRFSRFHSL